MKLAAWLKNVVATLRISRRADIRADAQPAQALLRDAAGHFAPVNLISPEDMARHEFAMSMALEHEALARHVAEVKAKCNRLADDYLARFPARDKFTVYSFDESIRVEIDTYRHKRYNAKLKRAWELMTACLTRWGRQASGNGHQQIMALATQRIDFDRMTVNEKSRLHDLLRIDCPHDAEWVAAQAALQDCFDIDWRKRRIRVYRRNERGAYVQVQANYYASGERQRTPFGKPKAKPAKPKVKPADKPADKRLH